MHHPPNSAMGILHVDHRRYPSSVHLACTSRHKIYICSCRERSSGMEPSRVHGHCRPSCSPTT